MSLYKTLPTRGNPQSTVDTGEALRSHSQEVDLGLEHPLRLEDHLHRDDGPGLPLAHPHPLVQLVGAPHLARDPGQLPKREGLPTAVEGVIVGRAHVERRVPAAGMAAGKT